MHWSSNFLFKYKINAITGEQHKAKRIVLDFGEETKRIRSNYKDAGYSKHIFEKHYQKF